MNKADMEQFAIAQALYKRLEQIVGTHTRKANLRTDANDYLRETFEQTGADRVPLVIKGQNVGSISLTFTTPQNGVVPEIQDNEKFIEWLRTSDGGKDALRRMVYGEPAKVLEAAIADGELPDGCAQVERYTPQFIRGQRVTMDLKKVADACKDGLPAAAYSMLGLPVPEVHDDQE